MRLKLLNLKPKLAPIHLCMQHALQQIDFHDGATLRDIAQLVIMRNLLLLQLQVLREFLETVHQHR